MIKPVLLYYSLRTTLASQYLVIFDNTSQLSADVSDELCAAVTGVTISKRRLYTDAELVILKLHNGIILNSIDNIPNRSDFVDRNLLFTLPKLTEHTFLPLSQLRAAFERDKPKILGAMFETTSKAMKILETLKISNYDRMADAYREMVAIAMALDIDEKEFDRFFLQTRPLSTAHMRRKTPL